MIAVVGGRGFIGGAIAQTLSTTDHQVIIVTHNPERGREPGFRYGDMRRPATLRPALGGAEVVVQSAMFRTYPIEKPDRGQTYMAYDGEGTEHLVAAAADVGARRYIYVAGAGVDPSSEKPYFRAIARGTRAVLDSNMESVVIGPTLVYGPYDRGLNRILAAARKLPVLPIIGDGTSLEQPVSVQDVAEVARQAVEPDAPEGKFEIGGPERCTLEEMLTRLFHVTGCTCRIVHVPPWLAHCGGAILERLPGTPLTRNAIDFIQEDFVADNTRVLSSFDLHLTPFEEGLRRYLI